MPVDDHHHDHDRYHDHHRGNDHEDRFEVRLGEALHQAGGAYETDRRALVAAGATRGHRLLLRRRAAVVAGVASVALVGLGGALLVPGGDDGRQSVATGAKTPVASATPKASYTGDELIGILEKLLPGASSARRKHAARKTSCRRTHRSSTTTARARRPSPSASTGSCPAASRPARPSRARTKP